jgi:hypothetical protein
MSQKIENSPMLPRIDDSRGKNLKTKVSLMSSLMPALGMRTDELSRRKKSQYADEKWSSPDSPAGIWMGEGEEGVGESLT